jgi:hypothetical protein
MVNDLFKAATKFYKLSQDPLAPIKATVEGALAQQIQSQVLDIKTVSLVGNDVKVDIHLNPSAGNSAGPGGDTNRSSLQAVVSAAVAKVDPTLKTTVTIDMSSEETLPKSAKLRANFAKFHKLSQTKCQPGDPLCDDLGAGLPPDEPSKPAKPVAPAPKPAPKPDTNKADDGGPEAQAQNAIVTALQAAGLGMRGFTWQGQSKHILVEVGVPREKKVSTKQVNDFLTQKIMQLAPGFSVITTLSTT